MKGRGSVSFPLGSTFCASIYPRPPPDRLLRMSSQIIDDDFKFWSYSGQAFLVVVVVVFFFDEKLLNWTFFSSYFYELHLILSQNYSTLCHRLLIASGTRTACISEKSRAQSVFDILFTCYSRMVLAWERSLTIMQYINCCARHHVKTFYSPS